MATTSTINHGDIHHQNTMSLHQISSLAGLTKSEGSKVLSYTMSSENTEDLIFFHTQGNVMDFLLEGEHGSSRESLANLLDEGLGTSLDGTDEISTSIHPTLGRNDSGVFSSDETTTTGNGTLSQIVRRGGGSSSSCSTMSPIVTTSTSSSPSPMVTTTCSQSSSSNSPSATITVASPATSSSPGVSQNASSGESCTSDGAFASGSSASLLNNGSKKQHRPKNTSPSRQGPQRCVICGKTFSNASALTKHKLTHSDERKHSCTVCGKAFKRQDHLNGHMLTHRSKKPFECSAKGCGKSYCDARSLRRHIESRHGHDALATMTIAPTPDSPPPTVAPATPGGGGIPPTPPPQPTSVSKKSNNNNNISPGGSNSSSIKISPINNNSNPVLCQSSIDGSEGVSTTTSSSSTADHLLDTADLVSLVDSSSLLDPSGYGPMDVIEMDQVVGGLKLEFRNEHPKTALLINNKNDTKPNNGRVVVLSRSSPTTRLSHNHLQTDANLNILLSNNNNNNSLVSSNNNNIIVTSSPLPPKTTKLLSAPGATTSDVRILSPHQPVVMNGVLISHPSVHPHHRHHLPHHHLVSHGNLLTPRSQLHQLLTQRGLSVNESNYVTAAVSNNNSNCSLSNNETVVSCISQSESSVSSSCINNNSNSVVVVSECSAVVTSTSPNLNNNNNNNFPCISSSEGGGASSPSSCSTNNTYQGNGSSPNSWPTSNNETEIGKGSSGGVFGLDESGGSEESPSSCLDGSCVVGVGPPSPILTGACSPSSLKEQLELIHQIIQQTQEESAILPPPQLPSSCGSLSVSSSPTSNANNNSSSSTTSGQSSNSSPKSSSPSKSSPKKSNKHHQNLCSSGEATSSLLGSSGSSAGGSLSILGGGGEGSGDEGKPGNEDKPVECAICYRRFKNTPALNGHMRLHGGYFKKDTDGKKKEHSSKESNGTPLQTASVSVRALIEEKIIQRRNTIINNTQAAAASASSSGDNKNAGVTSGGAISSGSPPTAGSPASQPVNAVVVVTGNVNHISNGASSSTHQQPTLLVRTSNAASSSSAPGGLLSNSNVESILGFSESGGASCSSNGDNIILNRCTSTTSTNSLNFGTNSSSDSNSSQTFPFEYEDNTDYLLMEEEVFNKVSSICPDSFFSGIEESILSSVAGSDSCSDQLAPDCWSWTGTSTPVTSSATISSSNVGGGLETSRIESLFNNNNTSSESSTSSGSIGRTPSSGASTIISTVNIKTEPGIDGQTSFTSLPPLDAVFYSSPGGNGRNSSGSPLGLQQQDSPSFIYPTPPASLESHTALQSPLFPFPTGPSQSQQQQQQQQHSQQQSGGASSSGLFPFESGNNSNNSSNNLHSLITSSSSLVLLNNNTLITTCSNGLNGSNIPTTSTNMIKTEGGVPIHGIIGTSPNVIVATTPCRNGGAGGTSGFVLSNSSSSNNNNPPGMSTVAFNTSAVLAHSEMMVLTTNGVQMGSNSSSSSGGGPTTSTAAATALSFPPGIVCSNAPASSSSSSSGPIIINGMKPFHLLQGGNIGLAVGVNPTLSNTKGRNRSGGTLVELRVPTTPSPTGSTATTSNISGSIEDSVQSLKELKVNEPSRMDLGETAEDLLFRSPHNRVQQQQVSSSPAVQVMKLSSPKRKQLRNTFASNLRPQTASSSNSSSSSHFTPYPILSPVRSAPGLYWTFSTRLSHVDESKKETPRINVGANFQAILPPLREKKNVMSNYHEKEEFEDNLWNPRVMDLCSTEEVDKYLEFACCSAIPGGGRNKEYALHILSLCYGDINAAMLLLMNPEPKLPLHLLRYKYPEREKWSRREISSFQESLLRHGKDFSAVAKEIGSKSREECVMFYQLWKKVCSSEYDRVRTVWKKREAAFTIELLKNIPPPPSTFNRSANSKNGSATNNGYFTEIDGVVHFMPKPTTTSSLSITNNKQDKASAKPNKALPTSAKQSQSVGIHEEFPCKVCGKIFSKVKSRSAHMKSHRPPESVDNTNSKKNSKSSSASSTPVTPPSPRATLISPLSTTLQPSSNSVGSVAAKEFPKEVIVGVQSHDSSLPLSPPDSSSQPGSAETCTGSLGNLKET